MFAWVSFVCDCLPRRAWPKRQQATCRCCGTSQVVTPPVPVLRVLLSLNVPRVQQARDADPNSMIRLAKMYLNGQGCQRNIAMAQEWVRKAR